jgi:hypothetical protein
MLRACGWCCCRRVLCCHATQVKVNALPGQPCACKPPIAEQPAHVSWPFCRCRCCLQGKPIPIRHRR